MSKEDFASVYTWLSWGKFNDRYSNYPNTKTDYMLFYNDDFFKNHTWYWDGKKLWAYGTEYMILVNDRKAIEWTPNVITSAVSIDGDVARIALNSITPNFHAYQMKGISGGWANVSVPAQVALKGDTSKFYFRSLNMAGVGGPEHEVVIYR